MSTTSVVSVPLALDNIRSMSDLSLLMFIGEAERRTSEIYEHAGIENDGRALKRIRKLETLSLTASRRVGRDLMWSLTDAGRIALRQLADNINEAMR